MLWIWGLLALQLGVFQTKSLLEEQKMDIKDRVVLVTGGNRGLGVSFVNGLIDLGVKKYMLAVEVLNLSLIMSVSFLWN